MILCLAYVVDDRLKAFLVVDRECASTLSPPFLANRRGRGIMCGEWTETFLLQRLEPAGAPGFELLPDLGISAWFKNARFRVTHGISARTLIGPALERVYATPG